MKRQNLIVLLLNLKKELSMQYIALNSTDSSISIEFNAIYCMLSFFNPDTVKNFTFLFKCTPVGAWALRLNDGTELKLSYR